MLTSTTSLSNFHRGSDIVTMTEAIYEGCQALGIEIESLKFPPRSNYRYGLELYAVYKHQAFFIHYKGFEGFSGKPYHLQVFLQRQTLRTQITTLADVFTCLRTVENVRKN